MATPTPSDIVKDKEYTNWLKVTLALHYMKLGLHTFIKNEIDHLHHFLVNKIYGSPTIPLPPCTMCHACQVKRNKYTGLWAFPKQCRSYCDVWLHELLALHINPTSDKIYWDNSTVNLWPFQSWECAKVFMPRGQQPSNVGPTECDAQALLTMLASCSHLHSKLSSSGLGLTHTISLIRNRIMHDSEMKLSDADRMNYIQQIIHFLEDPVSLKSMTDCQLSVINIRKIENDSMDIIFNLNVETTALRATVDEFKLELGLNVVKVSNTADSLKKEYKQLKAKFTARVDAFAKDLKRHRTKMNTMKRNVQQQVPRLDAIEENVQSFDTTLKKLKTRTDTVLQQHEKKHQEMDTTVAQLSACVALGEAKLFIVEDNLQSLDTKLQEMKTNTDTVLQQQDRKYQEMDTTVTHLSESVALHEIKLGKVEENQQEQEKKVTQFALKLDTVEEMMQKQFGNNSGMKGDVDVERKSKCGTSEAPIKRGPEGDGLKQLKTQTTRRPESDGLRQLKNQTEDKLDTLRRIKCIPTRQAEEARKLLDRKRSVLIKGNPGEGKTTTALHLIDNEMYRDRRVVLFVPGHWERVDTDWVDIIILEDIFGQFDLDGGRLQEWMVHLPTIQEHVDAGKLQVIITTRVDIMSKAYSKIGSIKLFSDDLSLRLSSERLNHSEKMGILNRELLRHEKNMTEYKKEDCITNFEHLIGFPYRLSPFECNSKLFGFPQCCSLFASDSKLFGRGPDFFKYPEKYFVENITKLEDTRFLALAFLFCTGSIREEYLSSETMPEPKKHLLMDLASNLNISKKLASIKVLRDSYNSLLELYVMKSEFSDFKSKSFICFTHATVCEAVGYVLGDRCPEMVVKHGDSDYLYQRTYAADHKDSTSQNVFIPVSVYGLLAERMVHDVVEQSLVSSIVKHSALRQHDFAMKLKEKLHKSNRVMNFFMAKQHSIFRTNVSKGECNTFMQYMLQSEDVVRFVYSNFLECLACAHNNNSSDCWQCEEKQKLLELALYYQHFQIADELVTMNATYTHLSLCNAARHGDLDRVHTIIEILKRSQVFNPGCKEAKTTLCIAYISGNQNMIELLLKESITLDSKHIVDTAKDGNINSLMKVVEHLKGHNKWNPHREHLQTSIYTFPPYESSYTDEFPCLIALHIAYCSWKFDMVNYLLKNEVKVSVHILVYVVKYSSQHVVARVMQDLKATNSLDPKCSDASVALVFAYWKWRYDACDLLVQEGVSLSMKNLLYVAHNISLESVKKAIQHLKGTEKWDPKCDDASEALVIAYLYCRYDECDLLVQEGVSLSMKNLPDVVNNKSLASVKKAIQHLKDTGNWDPKCDNVSKAFKNASLHGKYDVCELLVQEMVSLRMKYLLDGLYNISLESVTKAIQHMKESNNWDPKCEDASRALADAYRHQKYDMCDLLVQEGVSLRMNTLPDVVYSESLESVKKAIQHLKDTDKWDPKCDNVSKAFRNASSHRKYDVCELLVQEVVSLRMKNLPDAVISISLDSFRKAIQHMKESNNWDPKCEDASRALADAYKHQKYDMCDLLVQEGVSLRMNTLPDVVYSESSESVKKAIQHLKDTDKWDPKCDNASKAFRNASSHRKYDVCELLVQEVVSLRMKNLPDAVISISLDSFRKAIQHMKESNNWDPKCEDASRALADAYMHQRYDMCDLLVQEGVSLTMKNLPVVVCSASLESVKKAIEHLKTTDKWDHKSDDASIAAANASCYKKRDVYDLLVQEGVLITRKLFYKAYLECRLNLSVHH